MSQINSQKKQEQVKEWQKERMIWKEIISFLSNLF